MNIINFNNKLKKNNINIIYIILDQDNKLMLSQCLLLI